MSVTLTGTGGLFTRLGTLGALILDINGALGNTAPASATTWGSGGKNINALKTAINLVQAQFATTRQDLADGLYGDRDALRGAVKDYRDAVQARAAQVLIQMFNDDAILPSLTVEAAMNALYNQMNGHADKITTTNTTSVTAANGINGTPNGDGVCIASLVEPVRGYTLQNVFAEVINLICSQSSQEGATLSQETFAATGDTAATDPLAFDWPSAYGSGVALDLTAADAGEDSANSDFHNLLTNSDFETFTVANTPDSWTITSGSAGTDFFAAGAGYDGNNALKITPGGVANPALTQTFTVGSTNGQTLGALKPNTVYGACCAAKKGAGATGTLTLSLVGTDGSTVFNDNAATANTISKDISTLTTSYVFGAISGFFRTPQLLPENLAGQTVAGPRFRIRTASLATESVYVDRLCLVEAKQLYNGGPFTAIFSGATKFVKNDSFKLTVANDYAGAWVQMLERLFGMRNLLNYASGTRGIQLPSTGGGTAIADSLLLGV